MKVLVRVLVIIVVLIGQGIVCDAFASSGNGSEDTLFIADIFTATSINPLVTTSTISANLLDVIYDPLIELSPRGEILSALAKKWIVSPDGLEWTFELNKGVKFHDGSILSAHDVKATYEKIMTTRQSYYSFGLSNVERIDVISDNELRLKLRRYDSFIPFFLRHIYIVSAKILSSNSLETLPVIGTGAFKLQSFTPDHIELVAHEEYFRGKPELKKIVVHKYPNQRTCLSKLITEEADLIFLTDVRDYDIFSGMQDIFTITFPVDWIYFVVFNLRNSILTDVRVRKALNLSINRHRMNETNGSGLTEGNIENLFFTLAYDPRKALRLIKQSGRVQEGDDFFRSQNGTKLELRLSVVESDEVAIRLAQLLKDDFENIGINVTFHVVQSYRDLATDCYVNRDFDMMLMPSSVRSGMPQHYLFWHSEQIAKGGNFSAYRNLNVDKLLDVIRFSQNENERKVARGELSQALGDDPPLIPLILRRAPALVNKKFTGFSADPLTFFSSFRSVRIKKDR